APPHSLRGSAIVSRVRRNSLPKRSCRRKLPADRDMTIETLSEQRCFGGVQGFYRHDSVECAGPMRFSVFRPDCGGARPVLYFLAGLTCTEETFAIKAGAQRMAAELGLILVAPDTSPRDTGIEAATGDWEFGEGAGF